MTKDDKNAGQFPVVHGIYTWLRHGKINPSVRGHRRLQRYLKDIRADLIADLGGPDKLTAGKEALLEMTVQAMGVLLLAGAYCQQYSILRPDLAKRGILELQPILGKSYVAYLNTIRMNLVTLGLDAKEDEEEGLASYVKRVYGDKPDGQGEGK